MRTANKRIVVSSDRGFRPTVLEVVGGRKGKDLLEGLTVHLHVECAVPEGTLGESPGVHLRTGVR